MYKIISNSLEIN